MLPAPRTHHAALSLTLPARPLARVAQVRHRSPPVTRRRAATTPSKKAAVDKVWDAATPRSGLPEGPRKASSKSSGAGLGNLRLALLLLGLAGLVWAFDLRPLLPSERKEAEAARAGKEAKSFFFDLVKEVEGQAMKKAMAQARLEMEMPPDLPGNPAVGVDESRLPEGLREGLTGMEKKVLQADLARRRQRRVAAANAAAALAAEAPTEAPEVNESEST